MSIASASRAQISIDETLYLKGCIEAKTVGSVYKHLNWNLEALPEEEDMPCLKRRVEGIARAILDSNADLVTLQECFDEGLIQTLYDKLKASYAHFWYQKKTTDSPPVYASGLFTFSKLDMVHDEFVPHVDLIGDELEESKLGADYFYLIDKLGKKIATVVNTHFLGSSNCDWRKGKPKGYEQSLSQSQIRQQEGQALLSQIGQKGLPAVIAGDLNVNVLEKEEYGRWCLNVERADPSLQLSGVLSEQEAAKGTNTNFWKHRAWMKNWFERELKQPFKEEELHSLALQYLDFSKKIEPKLAQPPWSDPLLSHYDQNDERKEGLKLLFSKMEGWLDSLKLELNLKEEEGLVWAYFAYAAKKVIKKEISLWQEMGNLDEAPLPDVSFGKIVYYRALPIVETLDFLIGKGVKGVEVKREAEFDYTSFEQALSDHIPLSAHFFLK